MLSCKVGVFKDVGNEGIMENKMRCESPQLVVIARLQPCLIELDCNLNNVQVYNFYTLY